MCTAAAPEPPETDAVAAVLRIEVVYSPGADRIDLSVLCLPSGATLHDALTASGVLDRHRLAAHALRCGIHGRAASLEWRLRDRDRVELYRPLQVDPMQARRLRARKRG